jgi:hypothetical protein
MSLEDLKLPNKINLWSDFKPDPMIDDTESLVGTSSLKKSDEGPDVRGSSPACTPLKVESAKLATSIISLLSESKSTNKQVTTALKMVGAVYGLTVHPANSSAVSVFDDRVQKVRGANPKPAPPYHAGNPDQSQVRPPKEKKLVANQKPTAAWKLSLEGAVVAKELESASKAFKVFKKMNPQAKPGESTELDQLYSKRKELDEKRKKLIADGA